MKGEKIMTPKNPLKIIAVDFDGTLCKDKYPEIGEANEVLISYLKSQQEQGCKIILWTCRTNQLLANAIKWCFEQGLYIDRANENLPEVIDAMGGDTRKIFADIYIDDRSMTHDILLAKTLSES